MVRMVNFVSHVLNHKNENIFRSDAIQKQTTGQTWYTSYTLSTLPLWPSLRKVLPSSMPKGALNWKNHTALENVMEHLWQWAKEPFLLWTPDSGNNGRKTSRVGMGAMKWKLDSGGRRMHKCWGIWRPAWRKKTVCGHWQSIAHLTPGWCSSLEQEFSHSFPVST